MKKSILFALACFFCIAFSSDIQAQTVATETPSEEVIEDVTKDNTVTIKVSGIGCSVDIRTINTRIQKLEGVTSCETAKRGATTHFVVNYNSAITTEEAIHTAIEDTPGCKNPKSRPYQVKI